MIPGLQVLYPPEVAWVLACPNKGVAHKDAVIRITNSKFPANRQTITRDCRYIPPAEKNGPYQKAYDVEDPIGRNGVLCLFLEVHQKCLLVVWGTVHGYFDRDEASVRPWCKIVTPDMLLDHIVTESTSLADLHSWSFTALDDCFASLKGNGVLSRPWEFRIEHNVNQSLQRGDTVHYGLEMDVSGYGSGVTAEIREAEFMGSVIYEIEIEVMS
jgi:hypothetical protein